MFPEPLRAFYEAVRCGSVRKASEALGLAPSTVSRQILVLERRMGTALFERSASGVSLTHAGKLVADYARTVLLDYDSLRSDIDDLRGIRRGLVRITTVEGVVSETVVAAISHFRRKFDGIAFQLKILPAPKVIDAIKLGEADIGVTFCGHPDVDVNYEIRIHDPIILSVAPDHEFSRCTSVPLSRLTEIPLALPEPSFNIRQVVDRLAQSAGYALTPMLSSDSFVALRSFAARGCGAAVLTELSVRQDVRLGLLKAVAIHHPELKKTTIDVITLKARRLSSILKLFLLELKQAMAGATDIRSVRKTATELSRVGTSSKRAKLPFSNKLKS